MITLRAQFPDLVLANALPALDHVIYETRKKYMALGPTIYNMRTSDRWGEQHTGVTGLGQPAQVNEANPVRYDNPLQGFPKTYQHIDWGLGFMISHVSARDNRWVSAGRMAQELSRSFMDSRELLAASTFNRAFDTNFPGPDGVPLCSASHPLKKVGGVQSNILSVAADLDVDSLQLAYTAMALQVTHSGKPRNILPSKLMISFHNNFNAIELLMSKLRADTTNNATNAFQHMRASLPEIMPWTYLTDPDAWFLCAAPSDTELYWFDREKFYTSHDIDHDTRTLKTAGWEAHSFGWSDYIGVFGTPGAG